MQIGMNPQLAYLVAVELTRQQLRGARVDDEQIATPHRPWALRRGLAALRHVGPARREPRQTTPQLSCDIRC